jgi:hypothetical protein
MRYQDLKTLSKETSISVFKLREFTRMGLPHFRVGRKILVDPETFTDWFEEHFKAPPPLKRILSKAFSGAEG